jgi:membrane carboxypeptidase/penicillin-binding protein PbpC
VRRPDTVAEVTICALSGMRATAWCPSRAKEWVRAGEEALPCSWHHQSDEGLLTIYPPEYRAWAAAGTDAPRANPAPPGAKSASRAADSETLRIVNPPAGAIYSIDPTLRREFQSLSLRAVTADTTSLTWRVNGHPVGTTTSEKGVAWPLAVGRHGIEVQDAAGRRAATTIVVK